MMTENIKKKYNFPKIVQKDQLVYVSIGSFCPVTRNIILFVLLHILYIYGIYWSFSRPPDIKTQILSFSIAIFSGLGVTAGAHRLWSHNAYKAKLPLRFILAIGQTMAGQNCIRTWARDHRLHHKYSDTDADPHNINRGVFFSHCGWLLYRKHPLVYIKGAKLNNGDLSKDLIVTFQELYYYPLFILFSFIIPVATPIFLWNEHFITSFFATFVVRIMTVTHSALMINSVNHRIGEKPYNSAINPGDNTFVSVMLLGEGFHNFHHAFPYDYASAELQKVST